LSDLQRDLATTDRGLLSRNDPRELSLDPRWRACDWRRAARQGIAQWFRISEWLHVQASRLRLYLVYIDARVRHAQYGTVQHSEQLEGDRRREG
jgi:hypothetical protein